MQPAARARRRRSWRSTARGASAGGAGAIAGGLAFILPGLVLIIALAALTLPGRAAAVGARAGRGRGRRGRRGRARPRGRPRARRAGAAARRRGWGARVPTSSRAAVAAAPSGPWVVLVLLGCGLLELALRRGRRRADGWRRVLVARAPRRRRRCALAWTALKVGALSLRRRLRDRPAACRATPSTRHGWMTHAQFLNAVALGQITPGPGRRRRSRPWATPPTGCAARSRRRRSPSGRPSSSCWALPALRALRDSAGGAGVPRRRRAGGDRRHLRARGSPLLDGVHACVAVGRPRGGGDRPAVGRIGVVPVLVAAALAGLVAGVGGATL